MGIDKFLNIIKQQAALVNNSNASTALGTIVAYDELNHYASVQLYPADSNDPTSQAMITGMLPIFSQWVGSEWGFFTPPGIGDIVEVHFQEGSLQNGYIGLRTWSLNSIPLQVPSGEAWLVHKEGAYIKLTNNGKITIGSDVEIDVTAPVINIGGGAVNLGDVGGALTGIMNNIAIGVYNGHTHNTPSGVSDPPNQPLDASALTTNVQAN